MFPASLPTARDGGGELRYRSAGRASPACSSIRPPPAWGSLGGHDARLDCGTSRRLESGVSPAAPSPVLLAEMVPPSLSWICGAASRRFPPWSTARGATEQPAQAGVRLARVPLIVDARSVATTVTSPPRPGPSVVLLIWAPPVSVSRPTRTSRLPALPWLPRRATRQMMPPHYPWSAGAWRRTAGLHPPGRRCY